jgi:caspase domain-containing protein
MPRRMLGAAAVALAALSQVASGADRPLFTNSYALVVGINDYNHPSWPDLTYAVTDAQGFSRYLQEQGFTVTSLYDAQATRAAILSALEDDLAPRLGENDRVLVFFAGHGATRHIADAERGYLVPADGTGSFASLLPVTTLHDLSSTVLSQARHQLFILDSCFGGLAAMRGGPTTLDPRLPDYVIEVTKRRARQLLTAGGANQRVRDGGPGGHSFFTGQLLRALRDGTADSNGDGYITFNELSAYIQVAASSYNQTPGTDMLAGHEQGEFVFLNPTRATAAGGGSDASSATEATRGAPRPDVYALLREGKRAFLQADYVRARSLLFQAAELGNAEAMAITAKLWSDGLGGPRDLKRGEELLRMAAERGHLGAMKNLEDFYRVPGPMQNLPEAERWRQARAEAERLEAALTVIDPTGRAGQGDPGIAADAIRVRPPAAPTNLRILP